MRNRPAAAIALADAVAAWNLFEWDLAVAYSVAMGFYLPGIQGWEPPNHPMAFDIMDTIAGLGSRLDLMETALKRVAPHLLGDFAALRPDVRREAGRRAEIAHGRWGINERYPDDLILQSQEGFTRWAARDFEDRAARFNALRLKLVEFEQELREFAKQRPGLKPPPEFFPQEGGPPPQT
jgi:hypothetical protein